MAEHASDFTPGQMDISQNVASFHIFALLTKWGSLAAAAILALLVLWFCTGAGFGGGLITAAIITAIGIAVLRERSH
jgi:hypothetical protein